MDYIVNPTTVQQIVKFRTPEGKIEEITVMPKSKCPQKMADWEPVLPLPPQVSILTNTPTEE